MDHIETTRGIVDQGIKSLSKIANCENFEPGYANQIKAVLMDLYKILATQDAEQQEIYRKIALKDEHGNPKKIKDEKGNEVWDMDAEGELQAAAAYDNFRASPVSMVHRPKLYLSKLGPAKLSPNDLIQLEWIINGDK